MLNPSQLEALLKAKLGFVRRSMGKNGLELITRCPVCGKRKLSVNTATGIYKCWRGCTGGRIQQLLGNVRLEQNLAALDNKRVQANRDVELPGDLVPLTSLADDHHAVCYLKRRGLDIRQLDAWYGMRYCTDGRVYAGGLFNCTNTIVIPVYMDGKLKGWQSRLLYDPDKVPEADYAAMGFVQDDDGDWLKPPKYFTMPGMDKGAILWNYDWAKRSEIVTVCEGVFDAIAVGRCAVATFGKGVSDVQMGLLTQPNWKLVLGMLDPDAKTENAAMCHFIGGKNGGRAVAVNLEGYKDAGEAPQMEIWRQIDATIQKHGGKLEDYKFIV